MRRPGGADTRRRLGGAVLLAWALAAIGASGRATSGPAEPPWPALRIVSPAEGARVGPTVALVFETPADLDAMATGAARAGVHLHVAIDDTTLMPARSELVRLARHRWRYVFDLPAAPGAHTVSVVWSDARHRSIATTMRSVRFTVSSSAGARAR